LSAAQIAKRVLPSVALIVMNGCRRGRETLGSGFFVDKDLVATNKHVVECGSEGYITLVNRKGSTASPLSTLTRHTTSRY
jgi:S1-C subfamily serine protease